MNPRILLSFGDGKLVGIVADGHVEVLIELQDTLLPPAQVKPHDVHEIARADFDALLAGKTQVDL